MRLVELHALGAFGAVGRRPRPWRPAPRSCPARWTAAGRPGSGRRTDPARSAARPSSATKAISVSERWPSISASAMPQKRRRLRAATASTDAPISVPNSCIQAGRHSTVSRETRLRISGPQPSVVVIAASTASALGWPPRRSNAAHEHRLRAARLEAGEQRLRRARRAAASSSKRAPRRRQQRAARRSPRRARRAGRPRRSARSAAARAGARALAAARARRSPPRPRAPRSARCRLRARPAPRPARHRRAG